MKDIRSAAAGMLLWFVGGYGAAGAVELKGFVWLCGEGVRMCYWHKAVVAPPQNWVEDEEWSKRYQALVLFEKGDKSNTKAMMYLRSRDGSKDQSLEAYVRGAQERWKERVPDTVIEALPDFGQSGNPPFKVFLYKNPSQPEQAFELTAFMKGVDAAHPEQTYFFQAVLVSPTMAELERTKKAFYELLSKL